jgi:putative phosphoesterase
LLQQFPATSRSTTAKRILIVSDTHGQLHGGEAELARRCDIAVHAGDIGNLSVLRALRPRLRRTIAVTGNNDTPARWPAEQCSVLESIPTCARLALPGGMLVVEHGHRAGKVASRHQTLRGRHPEARLVVYGHSHRLSCDLEHRPWVVNPGAAGRARSFGGASCLVLEIDAQRWHIQAHRFETWMACDATPIRS